ncbi:unnamed protein product [Mytilus coruscus]|uniref:Tyrosinase copper-binding domain-containing protein n=1 Tax=Mytilus coruscus TaxID=42192 RepID=A0A6J8AZI7_MYTCO|nr:unnamed protein product [Mytilus coruscus]
MNFTKGREDPVQILLFIQQLINCKEQKPMICKIYRNTNSDHGICKSDKIDRLREVTLSPLLLNQLAVRLLTRSLFLALELGLDVVEYNQILQQNRNNPVKTTREILLLCQHKTLDNILRICQEIGINGNGLDEIASLLSNTGKDVSINGFDSKLWFLNLFKMKRTVYMLLTLTLFMVNVYCSNALSSDILDCLGLWSNAGIIGEQYSRKTQSNCIKTFLRGTKSPLRSDKSTVNYLNSLLRKRIGESSYRTHRSKRQTIQQPNVTTVTPDKLRHEVRTPNYKMVWERFANRTKRLANFTSVRNGISDYAVLASLHSGKALESVYGGPAYLAWQRIYLLLFEAAIGVPVPYWDCSLDFHMRDPTRSNVWSPKYFGNGFGELTTGPFKDFRTPSGSLIFRNVGADGTLLSKQSIELIMSKTNHSEITEPLDDPRYSLEGHALGVHVWVDGTFSRINIAAYDPIYFVYHSFIDMLWERFREQMISLYQQDPAWDYPIKGKIEHRPQNLMKFEPRYGFIPQFRNVQGYSESVANMIHFAPAPDCPVCLNTTELYCSPQDICISREVQENFPVPIPKSRQKDGKQLSAFARGSIQGADPSEVPKDEEDAPGRTLAALAAGFRIDLGPKFKCPFRDVRTRGDPISSSPNSSPKG